MCNIYTWESSCERGMWLSCFIEYMRNRMHSPNIKNIPFILLYLLSHAANSCNSSYITLYLSLFRHVLAFTCKTWSSGVRVVTMTNLSHFSRTCNWLSCVNKERYILQLHTAQHQNIFLFLIIIFTIFRILIWRSVTSAINTVILNNVQWCREGLDNDSAFLLNVH
jgi:hypothetical protein